MEIYDYNVKIILLGDYGVGKSTLIKHLSKLKDDSIGCCCAKQSRHGSVELEIKRGPKRILAKIFDTGGQERYRSLTASYYRGAHGCLLMYDVTREETFQNLQIWHEDLNNYGPQLPMSIVMVGNKSMSTEREVSLERGQKQAEHFEVPHMEMDIIKQDNVINVLKTLVDDIVEYVHRRASVAVDNKAAYLRKHSQDSASEKSCCAC